MVEQMTRRYQPDGSRGRLLKGAVVAGMVAALSFASIGSAEAQVAGTGLSAIPQTGAAVETVQFHHGWHGGGWRGGGWHGGGWRGGWHGGGGWRGYGYRPAYYGGYYGYRPYRSYGYYRPYYGYGYGYRPYGYYDDGGGALAAGLIGGALIGSAIAAQPYHRVARSCYRSRKPVKVHGHWVRRWVTVCRR